MSSFLNLPVMLTFLLSLVPFEVLVAGGSNVLTYPLAVRRPGFAGRGPGPDDDAVEHGSSAHKRFDNARFTYYQDGLGACNQFNYPGDFVSGGLLPMFSRAHTHWCSLLSDCGSELACQSRCTEVLAEINDTHSFRIAMGRWIALLRRHNYHSQRQDGSGKDHGPGMFPYIVSFVKNSSHLTCNPR